MFVDTTVLNEKNKKKRVSSFGRNCMGGWSETGVISMVCGMGDGFVSQGGSNIVASSSHISP